MEEQRLLVHDQELVEGEPAWDRDALRGHGNRDAEDAVCDGPDDKGIDGIYVDENLERVDIFQSKLLQNSAKTIGDAISAADAARVLAMIARDKGDLEEVERCGEQALELADRIGYVDGAANALGFLGGVSRARGG